MNKRVYIIVSIVILIAIIILLLLKYCDQKEINGGTPIVEIIEPFKTPIKPEFSVNLSPDDVRPGLIQGTIFIVPNDFDSIQTISPNSFIIAIFIEDSCIFKPTDNDLVIQSISAKKDKIATSIVLDYSGSMFTPFQFQDYSSGALNTIIPINELMSAVQNFFSYYQVNDIAEIIKFGSAYDQSSGFTSDKSSLIQFIHNNNYDRGATALYNSVYYAINNLKTINQDEYIRAVIAFADGQNNVPGYSDDDVINLANENKIPVFSVCFESIQGDCNALENISSQTGGINLISSDPLSLMDLYNRINFSIRNSYYIKFNYPIDLFQKYKGRAKIKLRIVKDNIAIAEYIRYL